MLLAFGEADPAIREPAVAEVNKMWKIDSVGFARKLLVVIKEGSKVPHRAYCMALIHATTVFKKTTNVAKTRDETHAYHLIDEALSKDYIDTAFPLFTAQDQLVSEFATTLVAHVAMYLMARDESIPVLPMICQKLVEPPFMLPCAKCLECVLNETFVDQSVQAEAMKMTLQLMGQQIPMNVKAQLIKVAGALIPALPELLCTPEDNTNFVNAMLGLTGVAELKLAAYDFWESLTLSAQVELFVYAPRFAEVSCADLVVEGQNEDVLKKIFSVWKYLCSYIYQNQAEALRPMVMGVIPHMLPICIKYAEMIDTDELDEEDQDTVFLDARETIESFAMLATDVCLPVLLNYAQQFLGSSNAHQREVATYVFHVVVSCAPVQEELTEQWAGLLKQSVAVAIGKLSDAAPRIVMLALKVTGMLADNYPTLHDFASIVPQLLPFLDTPLGVASWQSVKDVIALITDNNVLGQVCDALLEKGTSVSLRCLYGVLEKTRQRAIAGALMTKAVALADIIATEEKDGTKLEDVLDVLDMMVCLVGEEAIGAYDHLFKFAYNCLTELDSPRALVLMENLVGFLSNPTYTMPTMNQVLLKLADNESTLMRKAAVAGIRELTKPGVRLGIQQQFGDCLQKLLGIFEDQSIDLELRIDCLDAMNALHEAFPTNMQSFYGRLIPMYKTVIVAIPQIAGEVASLATEATQYVLGAIHLMIAVVFEYPREVESAKTSLIQMALSTINEAIGLQEMSAGCMISLIDVLKALLHYNKDMTLEFMASNPDLVELIKEAATHDNPVITEEAGKLLVAISGAHPK